MVSSELRTAASGGEAGEAGMWGTPANGSPHYQTGAWAKAATQC